MSPNYDKNSPIGKLIEQIGGFLQAQKAPTETLPYQQFAQPQQNVFNEFIKSTLRPQFEYSTLSPFKSNYSNRLAGSGGFMMGNAKDLYNRELSNLERGYSDQQLSAQQSFDDFIRDSYNRRVKQMGTSPTYLNNIGL